MPECKATRGLLGACWYVERMVRRGGIWWFARERWWCRERKTIERRTRILVGSNYIIVEMEREKEEWRRLGLGCGYLELKFYHFTFYLIF